MSSGSLDARKTRGSGIEGCRAVWLGELKGMSLKAGFRGDEEGPAGASASDDGQAGSDSG